MALIKTNARGQSSNLGRRNLIINGAMQVAQRGTSSTGTGYKTVDRMSVNFSGHDEAPTITQADVSSGTSPYTSGFRKSLKIQNGNQTSGAGGADELSLTYSFEAQDLDSSGWDVASPSSYVTLSFWVKSSVAQQFQTNARLYGPADGNQREFAFEYTVAANTWTKVTKTIPGHASNTLRGDNALGMFLNFPMFWGANYTANSRNFDTWEVKNNSQNMKDYPSTWWTTNDATWEITGIQLEVGDTATDFEHRSYAEELALCQRYTFIYEPMYYQAFPITGTGSNAAKWFPSFPAKMRVKPTLITKDVSSTIQGFNYSSGSAIAFQSFTLSEGGDLASHVIVTFDNTNGGIANGVFGHWRWIATPTGSYVGFDAEL